MDLRVDEKGKFYTSRVAKDTLIACIRLHDSIIVGNIYIRPEQRLKDNLNDDSSRFLPITNARVYDSSGNELLYRSSLLLIAYDHIMTLSPVDAISTERVLPYLQAVDE
jgi:hypothetical protein